MAVGAPVWAEEQVSRVIEVSGALPRSASLEQAELSALGATTGTWTLHGTLELEVVDIVAH